MQASCGREYSCLKRRKPLSTGHGHISQIVGRSTFDSPPDRHFEKTSRFTSRHSFIAFSVQGRRKKDVSRYESKTLRRSKSTMGKAKTYRRQQSSAKERRTHTSGTKETFPTDESSVGSNKKSCRRQKITYGLCPMRVYRPAVDSLVRCQISSKRHRVSVGWPAIFTCGACGMKEYWLQIIRIFFRRKMH